MPESTDRLVRDARAIYEAAVRAVQADRLLDAPPAAWVPDSLADADRVSVAGMGKAALAMAGVLEAHLPGRIDDGVVVVPEGAPATVPGHLPRPSTIRVREGGHPLPSRGSVRAGRRLLAAADALEADDLLLVPVSGGGTALAALPVEGIDLPDLKTTYHRLLTAGVPIRAANVVRKHLTEVGGGQLARAAHPASVAGLVVSDVVGDDLATIASGPTVPDPSTYEEALQVLYRHGCWHDVPAPVRDHLAAGARGRRAETPGPGAPCFATAQTTLVGGNEQALAAARTAAEERGYAVRSVSAGVEGEARAVGRAQARALLDADAARPTCWLWGGETTVTVTGEGTGGRNQEVALAAALEMASSSGPRVLLSGGTDGIDGPTDAAGAWATPGTAAAARAAGHDPAAHLVDNDAYPLFAALDQLLRPGPTHTNVMDVQVGLVDAP
jgi:hydroxypyruvate reductase